jgi:hypothetical protein
MENILSITQPGRLPDLYGDVAGTIQAFRHESTGSMFVLVSIRQQQPYNLRTMILTLPLIYNLNR